MGVIFRDQVIKICDELGTGRQILVDTDKQLTISLSPWPEAKEVAFKDKLEKIDYDQIENGSHKTFLFEHDNGDKFTLQKQ